jgi:hypothetical protein|tara:strand:+ start:540 stop:707 length:168 start_codon:yes stop_codon:yes gene_type:complete
VQSLGIGSLEDSHPITAEEHNDSAALGPARQGESLASGTMATVMLSPPEQALPRR